MPVGPAHAGRHGAGAGQSQPGALGGVPSRVVTVRWQALGPWSAAPAGERIGSCPHRWQVRRRQEWMTEYGELCRDRERIVHIARFYGVPG